MTDLSNISNTPNDNLSSVLEALKTEQSRRQTENKLAYYKPYRVQKYWPARVTEPHIVVVLVPKVGTTAFACRYKNKLCVIDFRICHRGYLAWNTLVESGPVGTDDLWSAK